VAQCAIVQNVFVFQRTGADVGSGPKDVSMTEAMPLVKPYCPCEPMDSEDTLFILYTSGRSVFVCYLVRVMCNPHVPCMRAYIHSHLHTHTHTLSHTLTLTHTYTHSLTHTHTLFITYTHTPFTPFTPLCTPAALASPRESRTPPQATS